MCDDSHPFFEKSYEEFEAQFEPMTFDEFLEYFD